MAMASDPDTSPAQTAGENSTYSVTTSDHNEKTDAVTSLSSSSERKRVVIVGAGLGGVVLAARLASLNKYDVLVFENNPGPGGRLSSIERSGFRFDLSGSSALLFPELIEAAFHDLGVEASDVLDLAPTGPSREFVFADGTRFAFTDDKEKLRATFESLEGKAGSRNPWSKFELFLKEGKGNYDAVTRNLLYADWSVSPLTALRPTLWPLLLRTRFVRSLSTFCERVKYVALPCFFSVLNHSMQESQNADPFILQCLLQKCSIATSLGYFAFVQHRTISPICFGNLHSAPVWRIRTGISVPSRGGSGSN